MTTLSKLFLLCLLLTVTVQLQGIAQAPPTELEGTFVATDHAIELRWHVPSTVPLHYNVYRSGGGDSLFHLLSTASDRRYDDSEIIIPATYRYRVTAVYAGDVESVPSNTVVVSNDSASTGGTLPPKNLTGIVDDRGVIELDWLSPDSSSPSFYRVYRSAPLSDTAYGLLGPAPESEFTDSTIADSTLYRYRVTAVYAGDVESVPSNVVELFSSIGHEQEDSGLVSLSFTSPPVRLAFPGQPYHYEPVVVAAPAGASICFTLKRGPAGMTIDPSTGALDWTPSSLGMFAVAIKARTCSGPEGEAEQEFRIMVASGTPGSLSGHVQDDLGTPLARVRIKIFDVTHGAFLLKTSTDSIGNYRFAQVSPGTYFVRADADSIAYEDQWFDGVKRIEDATPVLVQDTTNTTVNFTLRRDDRPMMMLTISGSVRDTAGSPIRGARVTALRVSDNGTDDDMFSDDHGGHGEPGESHTHHASDDDGAVAWTDSLGQYHLAVHAAHYLVSARAEGFSLQFYNGKTSPLDADVLVVNQDTSGIDFTLAGRAPRESGSGSISGRLLNEADSSGLRAHVIGFRKDPLGHFTGFASITESDSAGFYRLDSLPQGYYVVLARGKDDFLPTFYSTSGGTQFADSATTLFVNATSLTGIDLYLPEDSAEGLHHISGEVESEHSGLRTTSAVNPLGGVIVIVEDLQHRVAGSAITQSDGSYQVPGLASGDYTVFFQKPGLQPVSASSSVTYANNTPATGTVNALLADAPPSGGVGLMNVQQNWNLVSVPVVVADPSRTALFPASTSNAFSYNGSYQISSVLENGTGYWLKFSAPSVLAVSGAPLSTRQVTIHAGWNLIGSLSYPVSVSSLVTSPAGILSSKVFGYSGGYTAADVLEPGKGYWVKGTEAGTLTMNASAASPKIQGAGAISANVLTVSDASGNEQALYVAQEGSAINAAQFELPPMPPAGGFDTRFASQSALGTYPAGLAAAREFPIVISAAGGPITLRWSISDLGVRFSIVDKKSGLLAARVLGQAGSVTVQPSGGALELSLIVEPSQVPSTFALQQNYPNPFNPTTTIAFSLPVNAFVTLKVFNLIGQEVSTVLDKAELQAGVQSAQFNAQSLPSGVYFYRIEAAGAADPASSFKEVRKMVLLR